MFNCQDPKLTYLNGLGYNVVRLPREGIEPLDVLGRDNKDVEDLGPVKLVWTTTGPMPQVSGPATVPNVNGAKTKDLKLSIGLEILQGILSGMGAQMPSITPAFQQAQSIQFQFTNVASFAVRPLEVGNYLQAGDLNLANNVAKHYFAGEAEAFIITDVLKTNAIQVLAKDSSGQSITADIPAINNMLGVKVKAEANQDSSVTFTYQGDSLLTFGFKVFRIAFADGNWVIRGAKASGDLAFAIEGEAQAEEGKDPVILKTGGLLGEIKMARPQTAKGGA